MLEDTACIYHLFAYFFSLSLMQASKKTGIKMTIRHVFAGNPSEQPIYIKGTERGWNSETPWGSQDRMARSNGYPGHGSRPLRDVSWASF